MGTAFSARQVSFSSSQLERLIGRPSNCVADFASVFGWHGLSGHLVHLDVGGAANLLVMAIASQHGVELKGMRQWLPLLRNETLLVLARNFDNWHYDGCGEHEMAFYTKLSGSESKVRREVASLLGINLADTAALLRFHAAGEVECFTREQIEFGCVGRSPIFAIYATTLAERIEALAHSPLFISSPKADVWAY